jgi:hypothetical protein
MSSTFTTAISTGQWFFITDANPNAAIVAPRGSLAIRTDVGNASLWINTDNVTGWSTPLVVTAAGTADFTTVSQLLLADNDATALDIGSTGLLNLLRFDTTNGAEQMVYNGILPFQIATGGLNVVAGTVGLPEASLNVASVTTDAANNAVTVGLFIRKSHAANGGGFPMSTDVVLPARVGGWRVVDAYIISAGPTGGTVQVLTTGGLTVSNAMVPGNADVLTRATAMHLLSFRASSISSCVVHKKTSL